MKDNIIDFEGCKEQSEEVLQALQKEYLDVRRTAEQTQDENGRCKTGKS